MNLYDAVFFDLDGTLIAHDPDGLEAFIEFAGRVGIALTNEQIKGVERTAHRYWASGAKVDNDLARFDKRGFWVNYNRTLLHGIGIEDNDGFADKIHDLYTHYDPVEVIYADARPILNSLRQAGKIVGLVTNRDADPSAKIADYGLLDFFDFVLWGGKVSAYKPDAKIFLEALKMAGNVSPNRAVYVGDNYYADIVGARGVGMDCVLVDPRGVFEGLHDKRVKYLRDVRSLILDE
jgi:putative hydrolase of the HAD superfamily